MKQKKNIFSDSDLFFKVNSFHLHIFFKEKTNSIRSVAN